MAKRDLSAHQQKIVKRYYENADTITITPLTFGRAAGRVTV